MQREKAKLLGACLKEFIINENLEDGLLRVKIFNAWDKAVYEMTSRFLTAEQAETLTVSKFYKDKTLWCKMNSSVVRNQISMAKPQIISRMNTILKGKYINSIILS